MSLSHLIKGLLMLFLHSCLKIKEGLVGKQPGTAFPNQLPGDFLHKALSKMIYANLTSRLKMLHKDRAVCFVPTPSLNMPSACISAQLGKTSVLNKGSSGQRTRDRFCTEGLCV